LQSEIINNFELLKKKIVFEMQQSYPGINSTIIEWKGQDIVNFQEELLSKVNAHISEKWFYTHMKTDHASAPRIDVLNLLSKYVGYRDWNDFVFHNSETTFAKTYVKSGNRYFIVIPLLVMLVMAILFALFKLYNTRDYKFCFYDADTREAISNQIIEVNLLLKDESTMSILCDNESCFEFRSDESFIKMEIKTPYYKTDTIIRYLNKYKQEEKIGLHANEYALMIHYFSEIKVDDWRKRRSSLDNIIDDRAIIYQVFNNHQAMGMDVYNKWEFIDKMTMPTGSLRNIEILDTQFGGDKIMLLKFRIN